MIVTDGGIWTNAIALLSPAGLQASFIAAVSLSIQSATEESTQSGTGVVPDPSAKPPGKWSYFKE